MTPLIPKGVNPIAAITSHYNAPHPHTIRIENTSCTHTILVEQHGTIVVYLEPRQGAEVEIDTGTPLLIRGACEEEK